MARGSAQAVCVAAVWTLPFYPGVEINLESVAGQGDAWRHFAIGSIVFAAVAAETARLSVKSRDYGVALIAAVITIYFLAFNVETGIGNAARHSEHGREDRSSQNTEITRLARLETQSSQARKAQFDIAGDATPASIDGEIQAAKAADAKRWNATDGCEISKITRGPTQTFCEGIAKLQSKLAAAKARDEIDVRLEGLRKQMAGKGTTAVSLDPLADELERFLGVLGYHVEEKQSIASAYDWQRAAGLDVLAIFGPMFGMVLIGHMFAEKKAIVPEPQAKPLDPVKVKAAPAKPGVVSLAAAMAPKSDPVDDPEVHSFFVRCIEKCDGQHMSSAEIGALWNADCAVTGVAPGSPKSFSMRIRRYCQHDPNNNRPRYLNVRKRTAQPGITALKIVK